MQPGKNKHLADLIDSLAEVKDKMTVSPQGRQMHKRNFISLTFTETKEEVIEIFCIMSKFEEISHKGHMAATERVLAFRGMSP